MGGARQEIEFNSPTTLLVSVPSYDAEPLAPGVPDGCFKVAHRDQDLTLTRCERSRRICKISDGMVKKQSSNQDRAKELI